MANAWLNVNGENRRIMGSLYSPNLHTKYRSKRRTWVTLLALEIFDSIEFIHYVMELFVYKNDGGCVIS